MTSPPDRNAIASVPLEWHPSGNGAVRPREKTPDLLADVARLTEECATLRQVAAAQAVELERLSRRKDEFIAMATHDLKSPFGLVAGCAQFAARLLAAPSSDLDKVGRLLTVINDQIGMMTELVDDLFDASCIRLGALEVGPARCDISACLSTAMSMLAPDERARIDVTTPSATVPGPWDPRRIERVLNNLIGNALKYSPGRSRVTVVVIPHDEVIEVAVSDRGMGIPSDDLVQVFERFHRTPQAQANGRPGAGLGLYICRSLIDAHGGSLWAESAGEGLGATIRFTLPYLRLER